jgi:hypothetical protein
MCEPAHVLVDPMYRKEYQRRLEVGGGGDQPKTRSDVTVTDLPEQCSGNYPSHMAMRQATLPAFSVVPVLRPGHCRCSQLHSIHWEPLNPASHVLGPVIYRLRHILLGFA